MKKRMISYLLVALMVVVSGCSSSNTPEVEVDTRPSETETTAGDVVGDDSEIQQTTDAGATGDSQQTSDEEAGDKPTNGQSGNSEASSDEATTGEASGGEVTTTQKPSDEATTDKATSGETTSKKEEQTTTAKKDETTTKKPETTTKKPETTTKKPETTTKTPETTTKTPETTTTGSSNVGTQIPVEDLELDIYPSDKAVGAAEALVGTIIKSGMSQFDKVKAIHDWIVKNVDYDVVGIETKTADDSVYRADGALCNKLAVCQGYAEAFELLCYKAGIQAYMVYGKAGKEADKEKWQPHAWNVVNIDGNWYQIDCTWDDPMMNGQVVTDGSNITYAYFLLTDNEMYGDHETNLNHSINIKVCTSQKYKGYAEKMSIEASLSGAEHSAVVSTTAEITSTVKNWTKNGVYKFSIAVPQSIADTINSISSACAEGLTAAKVYGQYSFGYQMMDVGSYTVYDVTVTVTPIN